MTQSSTAPSPIFIHSLFRSGSTYLFKVFRRMGSGYTSFQEPLHEITVKARDNREVLIGDQGEEKVRQLRHPELDKPYFSELYNLGEDCLHQLTEPEIYDAYFAPPSKPAGIEFWRTLIQRSPGRPVLQECRTAGRIGLIRENLGGFHAYLWRNPRDQWWSYQVSPYFDLTTQLIFNASDRPRLVELVGEHIGFEPLSHPVLDVTFDWYAQRPLSPDQSYQAFYTLWLLALHSARQQADLLVNIDALSASRNEQRRISERFAEAGAPGADFSDCLMPASWYSQHEQDHFAALEETVHRLWHEAGLADEELQALLHLRAQNAPDRFRGEAPQPSLIEELARYRDLIRRRDHQLIARNADNDRLLQASHRREDQLRDRLTRQKAFGEAQAARLQAKIADVEAVVHYIERSRSWRITAPLRRLVVLVASLRQSGRRDIVRAALVARLVRVLLWIDRLTARFPRFRALLLGVICKIPPVLRLFEKVARQRHVPQPKDHIVQLNPRSRDIYRQLTAAMEEYDARQREEV